MATVSGSLDQSGFHQFRLPNEAVISTGSTATSTYNLQVPIVRQVDGRPTRIVCVLCDEQFSSDAILPHVAVHFHFNLYSCADCGDFGNCSDSMQLHGQMMGHRIIEGQTLDKEAYDLTMKIAQRCYKMSSNNCDGTVRRIIFTEDEVKQEQLDASDETAAVDIDANDANGASDLSVPDFSHFDSLSQQPDLSHPLNNPSSLQETHSPPNKRQRDEATSASAAPQQKSFANVQSTSSQNQPISDGHACANCGQWFSRLRQLNRHQRHCKQHRKQQLRQAKRSTKSSLPTAGAAAASDSVSGDLDSAKNEASKPLTKKRRFWVSPMFQCREELGEFQNLVVKELRNIDDQGPHFNYFRMSKQKYFELLKLVEPAIAPVQNLLREAISADERLCITLRFLVTGDSFSSLSTAYRISSPAICRIVRQTIAAILDSLSEPYLKPPTTENDWRKIAAEFDSCWNFPTALGAVDGRYVEILKQKGIDAFVLLAVCDANYLFRFIDVRAIEREQDAAIFSTSVIGQKLHSNELHLPTDLKVNVVQNLPFVFLGNEAFPLETRIMRPFHDQLNMPSQQAVFNYRLSRAHSVVDNALGLLACRWRIFQRKICAAPSLIDSVIKTTICLHNFLMTTEPAFYCPFGTMDYEDIAKNFIDGNWRKDTVPLKQICDQDSNNFCHVAAADVRNRFCDYFLSEPGVSWQ